MILKTERNDQAVPLQAWSPRVNSVRQVRDLTEDVTLICREPLPQPSLCPELVYRGRPSSVTSLVSDNTHASQRHQMFYLSPEGGVNKVPVKQESLFLFSGLLAVTLNSCDQAATGRRRKESGLKDEPRMLTPQWYGPGNQNTRHTVEVTSVPGQDGQAQAQGRTTCTARESCRGQRPVQSPQEGRVLKFLTGEL